MKVLGISGSMRKDGNTADLVNAILDRCHIHSAVGRAIR